MITHQLWFYLPEKVSSHVGRPISLFFVDYIVNSRTIKRNWFISLQWVKNRKTLEFNELEDAKWKDGMD